MKKNILIILLILSCGVFIYRSFLSEEMIECHEHDIELNVQGFDTDHCHPVVEE